MEIAGGTKKLEISSKKISVSGSNHSFDVVVVEDNHLTNTILSKALYSTIATIHNLKDVEISFSSFQNGGDFLNCLKNNEFKGSKLIVFSDYYLEENMNGTEILKNTKQKSADATVIIMSDSNNQQIPVETVNLGAHCFLHKDHKTPVKCSELLFQMVV